MLQDIEEIFTDLNTNHNNCEKLKKKDHLFLFTEKLLHINGFWEILQQKYSIEFHQCSSFGHKHSSPFLEYCYQCKNAIKQSTWICN